MSTQQVVPGANDFSLGRAVAVDPTKDLRHWVFLGIDHSAGKLKPTSTPRYEKRSGIEIRGGYDLGDEGMRLYGIKAIHRGWPTEILTHDAFNPRGVIQGDDPNADAMEEDGPGIKFSVGRTTERGWASDLAWSLESNDRTGLGIKVLGQYALDLPRAVMYWLATGLLAPVRDLSVIKKQQWLRDFDPERHLLAIPSDRTWQGWLLLNAGNQHPRDYLFSLALHMRDECLESCVKGEARVQEYYDGYIAEMREALIPGHGGIRKISDALRMCCSELELPTPDDLARQVAVAQAQAAISQVPMAPSELKLPAEFMELFKILMANQGIAPSAPPVTVRPDDFPDYDVWLAEKKAKESGVQPATAEAAGEAFADFSNGTAEIQAPPEREPEPQTLTEELGGPKSRTLQEKAEDEEPFKPTPPRRRRS